MAGVDGKWDSHHWKCDDPRHRCCSRCFCHRFYSADFISIHFLNLYEKEMMGAFQYEFIIFCILSALGKRVWFIHSTALKRATLGDLNKFDQVSEQLCRSGREVNQRPRVVGKMYSPSSETATNTIRLNFSSERNQQAFRNNVSFVNYGDVRFN